MSVLGINLVILFDKMVKYVKKLRNTGLDNILISIDGFD